MPGVPINSLQDLLLLRELKNEADPFRSAIGALAQGVSNGITKRQEEAKLNKQREDEFAKFLQLSSYNKNTNENKIKSSITYDENSGTVIKYGVKTDKELLDERKVKREVESAELQSKALEDFLQPGSDLTEIDLIRSGISPNDIQKIVEIKNISEQQTPNINMQNKNIGLEQPTSTQLIKQETKIPSGDLFAKGYDVKKRIPENVISQSGISKEKQVLSWADEAAQRDIKASVIDPKLNNFMDVGGRAYKELKDVAKKEIGVDIDFSKGGTNYYKNLLIKKGLGVAKLTPLMTALDNLRPEIGTELMRQLGSFRSAEMAQKFANTLAQFNGNIKEDIANMVTTISKNAANTELLDDNGNPLPDSVRDQKMKSVEANLIRKYNFMYRDMGLIKKPYTAERSFDWLAENSTFNDAEENVIQNAMSDNPNYTRKSIVAKLIEQGIL
jgi:hypothetical protein